MEKRWIYYVWAIVLIVVVSIMSIYYKKASSMGDELNKAKLSKPEVIKIRLWDRLGNDKISEEKNNKINEFNKSNPDIFIEHTSIPDEVAFKNKIKTSIASGDTPEIFYNLGGESFKVYVENHKVEDLSPALDGNIQWKEDFLPDLMLPWQYSNIKGTYGIPNGIYGVAIYYNKALFKKAGVEPPQTMKQFMAAAEKLQAAGIIPLALGEKDIWRGGHLMTNLFLKKLGYQKIKELVDRKAKYNDPEIVGILKLMEEMNQKGIFGKNAISLNYDAENDLFDNEKTAMHMNGSWYINDYLNSPIKDKIGFFPFPYFEEHPEFKDVWMGGASEGLSVAAGLSPDKKKAAFKVIEFLTSKAMFDDLRKVNNGGLFPVKLNPYPNLDPLTLDFTKVFTEHKVFWTEVAVYDPLPQLLDVERNAIQAMFGGLSAEEAANQIADEVTRNSR